MANKVSKPAARKPAAKKPVAGKPDVGKPTPANPPEERIRGRRKRAPNRVPPHITRKPPPPPETDEYKPVDTERAVAFAMSIAAEKKKSEALAAKALSREGVRLSRRPTSRSQGKSTAKFPASDLREFRKRLLEARAQATSGITAMRATGFNETDDHEADGGDGTNQMLRLQALGQMGNMNRTIQRIDEALHRIDDGTYGVCTSCGQLIRKPRLINQPFVLTCMECQAEMEREAR